MLRNPAVSVKPPWSTLAPMVVSVFFSLLIFAAVVAFGRRSRPNPLKLDFELPTAALSDIRSSAPSDKPELWIRIRVAQDASGVAQPRYFVQDKSVADKAELRAVLGRFAGFPGARDDLVVLDPDQRAPLGWVITVLDCLNDLGFKCIRFKPWVPARLPGPETPPM